MLLVTSLWCADAARPARMTTTVTVDGIKRTALVDPGKEAATTPSPVVVPSRQLGEHASDMTRFVGALLKALDKEATR
jgi:hypothetical protein